MDPELTDTLVALEKRLHEPAVRRSGGEVAKLLADSFVEIASSGKLYTRGEIIEDLATEDSRHIEASDFAATQLHASVIKVTYKTSTSHGDARRESIWLHTEDGWKVVFHRGTPA
ncbi:MAG: DUF4440 domain-containing protein [Acidimicrobiia bacterium]|nr:DUF4440 domain-containing protein [Acidimicrobiia bacterium]